MIKTLSKNLGAYNNLDLLNVDKFFVDMLINPKQGVYKRLICGHVV